MSDIFLLLEGTSMFAVSLYDSNFCNLQNGAEVILLMMCQGSENPTRHIYYIHRGVIETLLGGEVEP